MKTHLLILIFTLCSIAVFAQQPEKRKKKDEKIEALHIGYITKALDLTVEESKAFWPVFNAHEKKRKALMEGRKQYKQKIENLDEAEASKMIEEELKLERQVLDLKSEFIADLKTVIPNTKIAKLLHAQKRFRKELLDKMKGRKKANARRRDRRN